MNNSWWQQFEGQIIDNAYRLVRLLGIGGFGGVFLAEHIIEGTFVRNVAVKLVVADAGYIQRQLAELAAATTLRHPSLLNCFHAGACTMSNMRLLYLVMELAGTTLEARLEQGPLPPSEIFDLTSGLAAALDYLHQHQRVHRDVKPGNILLVDGAWKLSDFGSVRQSSDRTSRTSLIMGSMSYMPPESFDGVVSPAWDLWSLGILLLRALTGQPAYRDKSDQQLMRAILDYGPLIPPDLPRPYDEIIRGCLQKDHRARWSAQQIKFTLDEYRNTPPLASVVPAVASEPEPGTVFTPPAPSARPQPQSPVSVLAVSRNPYRDLYWATGAVLCLLAAGGYVLTRTITRAPLTSSTSTGPAPHVSAPQSTTPSAPPIAAHHGNSERVASGVRDPIAKPVREAVAPAAQPNNTTKSLHEIKGPVLPPADPKTVAASAPPVTPRESAVPPVTATQEPPPRAKTAPVEPLRMPNAPRSVAPNSSPVAVFAPTPEYTEEARKARFQGTVLLSLVVDENGNPRDLKVIRRLGMGLDEKAIECVQKWKFRPATIEGRAVPARVTVNVDFRLL